MARAPPLILREPGTFTRAATLYPVASARVGLGPALHPALTPMTPHERDPFVERSKADNTRTRTPGDNPHHGKRQRAAARPFAQRPFPAW